MALLQNNIDALRQEFEATFQVDKTLLDQIVSFGFDKTLVEEELKKAQNDPKGTIEGLIRLSNVDVNDLASTYLSMISDLAAASTSRDASLADEV